MARLVALEWDAREARVAVATTRGSEVLVEQAFAVPFRAREAGESIADADRGKQIAAALAAHQVARGETLVALGRANIELRTLNLPPAPAEELPDLVRFQAMRSFAGISEAWPLDYVEIESTEQSRSVLAAAISPDLVEQIKQTCASGDMTPSRLVLRPMAAASLLRRHGRAGSGCCLVVDLLADEADLTALAGGHVVFTRTVRLPSHEDPGARALTGELRRTIGAAQNQMGGRRIETIILCGREADHAVYHERLAEALSLEIVSFDPMSAVSLSRELAESPPDNPGRFAPLLGMLADEAAGAQHAIDFLHPRRRAAPPNKRRRNLVGAAAAAGVLLAAAMGWYLWLRYLDTEIAALARQSENLAVSVTKSDKLIDDARHVLAWQDGDITWLDEVRSAALRMRRKFTRPDGRLSMNDDAILSEMQLSSRVEGGGDLALKGYVREAVQIAWLEDTLRFSENVVSGKGSIYDSHRSDYKWFFEITVQVKPDFDGNGRPAGRPYRDKPEIVNPEAGDGAGKSGGDGEAAPRSEDEAVTEAPRTERRSG